MLRSGRRFRKPCDDLLEAAHAARAEIEGFWGARIGIAIDRQVQHLEGRQADAWAAARDRRIAEPGIDIACGPLAVADRDGDGLFPGNHIAAGENARMAGHHVGADHDRAVRSELDAGQLAQKAAVGLLAERKHDRVGLERLEPSRGMGPALGIEFHHLDREVRADDFLDRRQPLDLEPSSTASSASKACAGMWARSRR